MEDSKANLELKFIGAVLRDGYKTAIEAGFKPRVLLTESAKEAHKFIKEHHDRHGAAPTLDRFRQVHPDLVLPKVGGETISALIEDLNAYYTDRVTRACFGASLNALNTASNPEQKKLAADEVRRAVTKYLADIADVGDTSSIVDVTDDEFAPGYIDILNKRAESNGLRGIPYIWPTITDKTLGMEDTQLIVAIARPKVGKTFFLVAQAGHSWGFVNDNYDLFRDKGRTDIVLISNEVTTEEMLDRLVSFETKVSYRSIRSGNLTKQERDAVESTICEWNSRQSKLKVVGTEGMGIGGVSLVEAILLRHKPAVLYIDGAYLLTDDTFSSENVYLNMGQVVRKLKILAKTHRVPIFVTWQFNRNVKDGGDGSFSAASGTDRLGQDSDVFFAISAPADVQEMGQRIITSPGSRACPPFKVTVNFSPETGDYSEVMDDEEAERYEGDF